MMKCRLGHKVWVFGVSFLLALAGVGLTACGSSQGSMDDGIVGRLTSVSDTKVVVEVFDRGEGTPPTGFKRDGRPDGVRPEGTPPADLPEMKQKGQKGDRELKRGESKTFVLNDTTKIYKQEGEEKTEISIDELELGSMISIVAEGDTAGAITVRSKEDRSENR